MTRIVIIGGGIAGLAAAYYAKTHIPDAHITVIEADSHWGGKIMTDRVAFNDGQFIIEGGPDSFLATKPWGAALCKELGLGERLHGTNPQKNTYILKKGHLLPIPEGLAMMIPSDISSMLRSRLISWFGKLRMGLDLLLPTKTNEGDESLGAFVSRRFGREAYENFIEPLMSGIYAGDGDQLSLRSTFPYLRDLETKYGSLARGARQVRKQSNGQAVPGSRSAFLTLTTGLAEVVESLVEHLSSNRATLCLNTCAARITRNSEHRTWETEFDTGESIESDGLILATPAYVSGTLCASFDLDLGSALQSIPYTSTATVSLGYPLSNVRHKLDGYGYVIPRREGRKALACTWTSTKFPHRAPEGHALIRVFIGRAGQDILWNENELVELAKEELNLTLGVTAEPLISRVFMWDKAMPQYNLGHPEILNRIDAALENQPGLALAGNGYRGIGIPDCIHSGELAIEKVTRDLSQEPAKATGMLQHIQCN
ncbi:MAG TPA: protoporphyrinogen oxidase [Anaerolineales bacterium]|nr:protoporphyrinogen oxidase [Anaerolineales bacterium]